MSFHFVFMVKRTGPTNIHLRKLIDLIKSQKSAFWKAVALNLSRPSRIRRVINLSRINRLTKPTRIHPVYNIRVRPRRSERRPNGTERKTKNAPPEAMIVPKIVEEIDKYFAWNAMLVYAQVRDISINNAGT